MLKKHLVLYALIIALMLLVIATLYYPGGSQLDKDSIGYSWANNYLSNLFTGKAINGLVNGSRPWAIMGMLFLCIGFALFFMEFSKKIPAKGASAMIRYFGAGAMLFAFLAVTPYHDIMVTIAVTMALVSMFYITAMLFKAKLHLLKMLSVLCLLIFYTCVFIYYSYTHIEYLPVLQKTALVIVIVWAISLQYFTTVTDFSGAKPK